MSEHHPASAHRALGIRTPRLSVPVALIASLALLAGGASATAKRAAPSAVLHPQVQHAKRGPLASRAMWIWYLSASNGGNVSSIVSQSHRYGIGTLIIKSADGTSMWSQFNPGLVSTLHANHIHVCAWQYVYGTHPVIEADLGAAAVRDGADCLLIDAEAEYEGRYVQAQSYLAQLRKLIGNGFPVALASFPYVFDHPAFPYSVFLGPGGAQYDVPQMYWIDIGTTVDRVYSNTYTYNRPYQRQLDPLGQVYDHPPPRQILRFRQLSRAYRAPGVSWWDWQEATAAGWHALSEPVGSLKRFRASPGLATLQRGSQGDLVVWAQEHLLSAGYRISVDGAFGPQTESAVKSFQQTHRLSADGVLGTSTWRALLRYRPATVHWTSSTAHLASAARASGRMPVPKSASLPAKRYEIPRDLGAGPDRP